MSAYDSFVIAQRQEQKLESPKQNKTFIEDSL
jgi:hypothetical protein